MEYTSGNLYFISEQFFSKANDPYLKQDHIKTKRPHYIALKNDTSSLIWVVPCSTQWQKYENIIAQRKSKNKPTDIIKIVTIHGIKQALLFQDMFPVLPKYIESEYCINNVPVGISDPKLVSELEKNAHRIITLLHRGIKFTPTQPDILRIEKLMLAEERCLCVLPCET